MDRQSVVALAFSTAALAGGCQFSQPTDRLPPDAAIDSSIVDASPGPFLVTYGGSSTDFVVGAVGVDGSIVVVGGGGNDFRLFDTTVATPGLVVAKLTPFGQLMWLRHLDAANIGPRRVAVSASGDVVVGGTFFGTLSLGASALVSQGLRDAFVLEFAGDSGDLAGAALLGGVDDEGDYLNDLELDPAGNVYVAASYSGSFSGCGVPHNAVGSYDAYVARYDAHGLACRWERVIAGSASSSNSAIAVSAAGQVVVGTMSDGDVSAGGQVLTALGQTDVVVARYQLNTGAHLASVRLGSSVDDEIYDLDGAGSAIFLSGPVRATTSIGGAPLVPLTPGQADRYIARLDESSLAHRWSRTLGVDGRVAGSMHLDGGELALSGSLSAPASVGGPVLTPVGSRDALFARYSVVDGSHLDSQLVGGLSVDDGAAQWTTPYGVVWFGTFGDTVQFPSGPRAARGGNDVFVMRR